MAILLGGIVGALPQPERATDAVSSFYAAHTMLLSSNDPSGAVASDTLSPNQIVLLATVGDVPQRVADKIGYTGNAASLAAQVSVELDFSSNSMQISTRQSTADAAVQIADAFAEVLTEFLATYQDGLREKRIAAAQTRLVELEREIEQLSAEQDASPDDEVLGAKLEAVTRLYSVTFEQADALEQSSRAISLVTLQSAQPIAETTQGLRAPGSRKSRGLLGAIAGGAVGLAAVFVLNMLDRRIRQRSQAEAILGVPVQLTIPVARRASDRGVAVRRERHDPVSDAYRAMRSVLALAQHDRADPSRAPITLVLSSGPGDGKTTASANIAAAFAESGAKTIAVNTDFRRPALSKLLGAADGATEERTGGESTDDAMRLSPIVRGLRVYDARLVDQESTPGDLARRTVQSLPFLTTAYEQVVIDTPPVSLAAEVLELLPHADSIIVMVRLGHTRIDAAAKTAETLRALGITNFVLVVIGGATDRGFNYYGYGYGYGYTYGGSRAKAAPPRREPVDAF